MPHIFLAGFDQMLRSSSPASVCAHRLKSHLLATLHAAGVNADVIRFLDVYLSPGHGKVVVQGSASQEMILGDFVFQGRDATLQL